MQHSARVGQIDRSWSANQYLSQRRVYAARANMSSHIAESRDDPSISVVVPLFNEESTVALMLETVESVLGSMPRTDHEIVCVDDGSSDSTLDLLIEARTELANLKVVVLSRNFGHQAAVTAGLDHASGDVVLVIDGDLQDDPRVLPRFVEEYKKGADVVYAVRVDRPDGVLRRLGYAVHYRLLSMVSDSPVQVQSGDFALLSRRVVDLMIAMPERQRYLRGLRSWVGLRQVGVEVARQERVAGESKYGIGGLASLAFDGIFAFSRVPLRIATVLGLLTVLAGFLYGLFVVIARLAGAEPQGFATLALLQVGFSGMLLLVLGVIGEYVGRIYDEVKQRPIYVVDQVLEQGL